MIPAKAAAQTYLPIRSACIITTTAPAQTTNADRAVAALLAERANRAISITSARTDAHFIVLVIICNLNFLYDSSWGEPSATRRTAEASLHRACGSGLRERCRSYLRRAYGRRSFDDLGQRRKDLGVS